MEALEPAVLVLQGVMEVLAAVDLTGQLPALLVAQVILLLQFLLKEPLVAMDPALIEAVAVAVVLAVLVIMEVVQAALGVPPFSFLLRLETQPIELVL